MKVKCPKCGYEIEVSPTAKTVACPNCGAVYKVVKTRKLGDNSALWWFLAGLTFGAIVFTSIGRATVKTLGEATLQELQAAIERRKRKLAEKKAIAEKAMVW